ncbi:MAG: endonuclease/exonuclease/phosphatase family protein [Anaerolineae bacterium]|nr:endonuclease/exonuclease/phosphatase family protein [Anaerolineae bacterium]
MTTSPDSITQNLKKYSITAITTIFGLQMLRVLLASFSGYLRDSVGMGSLDLAPVAIGIFAISFLAGIIWRYLGAGASLWLTAGGVALLRAAEQISISPAADLYLSAVGSVMFMMYIPVGIALVRTKASSGSAHFGLAFLLGIATDTAILVGSKTVDLSWQAGSIPIGIILILAGFVLIQLSRSAGEIDGASHRQGHWSRTTLLFALGPWLMLQMLVFQNVPRLSALTGWGTPISGGLVILGNAAGLAAAVWVGSGGLKQMTTAVAAGIILVVSLFTPEPMGMTAAIFLLIGQILTFILAYILFAGLNRGKDSAGIARSALANGAGMILYLLMGFAYYLSFDISIGIRAVMLLPVLAAMAAIGSLLAARGAPSETGKPASYKAAVIATALLVVPLAASFFWIASVETSPSENNKTVRVMSYNLHNAFNTDGRLDLEALAVVIEESGAEVIALQEISRGWLIWGSVDMMEWLAQRLGMNYVYGPAADAQWGNAILSKYPIISAENHPLDPDTLLIQRSYIQADIDIGGGIFTMIATHFTHVDEHTPEREIQSSQLIEAWNGAPTTVILGDLNARPDESPIAILNNAGLIDVSAVIGEQPTYTYYSDHPDHQIDYIFVSPDLAYRDFSIPLTTASDHLPLVVTITLP